MEITKVGTLIGSDKGGVGKSLLAQIMANAHDRAGVPLKVVEIDHQRKLTGVLGNRVDLSLGAYPGLADLERDRTAAGRFFDAAYDMWSSQDSLTDLGANVTTTLFDWMKHRDVASIARQDGLTFRFVAVATPDDQALRSAAEGLQRAKDTLGDNVSLVLVLNDTSGIAGFTPYHDTPEWRQLTNLREAHGVSEIMLPRCESSILEWGRAWKMTIIDIVEDHGNVIDRISAAAGFSRLERHHQVRSFIDWVGTIQDRMHPLWEHPLDQPEMRAAE